MFNRRSRILLGAILALSIAGAWFSGRLLTQHAGIWRSSEAQTGLLARLCSAVGGPEFDCHGASTSGWAEVSFPIPEIQSGPSLSFRWGHMPVAFLGLAYFVSLGAWFALIGAPRPIGSRWQLLPRILALCGATVSCIYLGIMALGMAPWCLGCVTVHVINFATAFLINRMYQPSARGNASVFLETNGSLRMSQRGLTTTEGLKTIAVAMTLVLGLGFYYRQHVVFGAKLDEQRGYKHLVDGMRRDPDFLLREYLAQPRYDIPARDSERDSEGPRLVLFTDYECPACKCAARSAEHMIDKEFGGGLDIALRHYPLCSTCNHGVRGAFHPNACEAARAAEAARRLGGEEAFRRMSEQLFEHRTSLSVPLYPRLAAQIGLDEELFVAEMNGPVVRQVIEGDIALARMLGVTGTPTLFLDGRRITELCQTPVFWEAVARLAPESPEPAVASGREPTNGHFNSSDQD